MLQRKSIDQHELCWFANLFSNFLILRALSVKKYQKHEILFLFHQDYFLRFLRKYPFFAFICMFTETETNIYYMDSGILLGTKTLVELIRHYIRDTVRVFSVCHA